MGNSVGAHSLNIDEHYYDINRISYTSHNLCKQSADIRNGCDDGAQNRIKAHLDGNTMSADAKDKHKSCLVLPATFSQSLKLRATRNGEILHAGGTISGRNDATHSMQRSRTLICESRAKSPINENTLSTARTTTPMSREISPHKFKRSQTTINISYTSHQVNSKEDKHTFLQNDSNLEQMRVHSRSQPDFTTNNAKCLLNANEKEQLESTATMLRTERPKKYKKKRRAPAAPAAPVKDAQQTFYKSMELPKPKPMQAPKKNLNAKCNLYEVKKPDASQQLKSLPSTSTPKKQEFPAPRKSGQHSEDVNSKATDTKATTSKIPKLKKQFYFGMNAMTGSAANDQFRQMNALPRSNDNHLNNATSYSASDRFLDKMHILAEEEEEKFENGLRLHLRPILPRRQQSTPVFCPIVAWRSLLTAKPIIENDTISMLSDTEEPSQQVNKYNINLRRSDYVPNVLPAQFSKDIHLTSHDNSSSSSNNDHIAYDVMQDQKNITNKNIHSYFSLPKSAVLMDNNDRLTAKHNDNWMLHKQNTIINDSKLPGLLAHSFEPISLTSLTSNHVIYLPGHTNNLSTNIKSLTLLNQKTRQIAVDHYTPTPLKDKLSKDAIKESRRQKDDKCNSQNRNSYQSAHYLLDKHSNDVKISNNFDKHIELDVLTSVEEDFQRMRDSEKASIRQQLLHYLSKSREQLNISTEQSVNLDYNENYDATCLESSLETKQLFIKNAKFNFTAN